jgi:hypothetical protein
MEEAEVFVDRATLQVQKSPTYKSLGVGNWILSHAPDPSDIIWDNVSITPLQQIIRFALINSVILFGLIFFFFFPLSFLTIKRKNDCDQCCFSSRHPSR